MIRKIRGILLPFFLYHILFKEGDFAYLNVIDLYRMLFEINFGI